MSTEITEPRANERPSEHKQLARSKNNSMIAGVCAGIADYFDIDSTIVRIAFVLFTVFGGSAILVYIILWIVLPESENTTAVSRKRAVPEEMPMDKPTTFSTDNASNWIAFILVGLGVYFLLRNLGLTFSVFDLVTVRDIVPIALIVGGIYLYTKNR